MSQETKATYTVNNLSCANCALKIEKRINEIDGVTNANLNIATQQLTLNLNGKEAKELLTEINDIANAVEPGTKFSLGKNPETDDEDDEKFTLIRLVSGTVLFLAGVIIDHFSVSPVMGLILFFSAYIIIGYSVIFKAFRIILHGEIFDENFLMMLATFAAIYVRSYPEAVAVMLFYEVGEYFQDRAVDRSRKSIKNLLAIQPKIARIKKNNEIITVNPQDVKLNDILVVRPGDLVPLDGIVINGASEVDTSKLTGESLPLSVSSGSEVLAGFINFNGLLEIKVTKLYEDSAVSKILELVENAQSKKAKVEKWITKFAKVYTPIVILLAVLITVVPILFDNNYEFNDYLYRGATFLVVSCPCALVISIPLSIFGGIGASSRHGILIKGGNYLEILRHAKVVVFDKTGTLTKGNFVVTKVVNVNYDPDEFLALTISAENLSNHAISKTITKYKEIDLTKYQVSDFQEFFGKGIKANINNKEILVGNSELMKDYEVAITECSDPGTIVYVAVDKTFAGFIVINDEIKPEAAKAMSALKKTGITKTVMLTGDNLQQADVVGKALGIDEIYANLLPEDKLTILEKLKQEHPEELFIFVGDGVNDTPVLTASDLGVSMGALGSDAAIETSDVVIMNDNLLKLATARKLAALTHNKIWQNIILALGVKIIVLILSAFGIASMWMAVFSDVGVALLAILNSILILRFKE